MMGFITRLLTWNACTLNGYRRDELNVYMQEHSISIAAITESSADGLALSGFSDFIQYSTKDLTVLVKHNIAHVLLERVSTPSCEAFLLESGGYKYLFAYLRNGREPAGMTNLLNIINEHRVDLIMGDLNANMRTPNRTGRMLSDFLDNNAGMYFDLNHEQKYTWNRLETWSTLDYCLVSERLEPSVSYLDIPKTFSSDHFPLILHFEDNENVLDAVPDQHFDLPLLFSAALHRREHNQEWQNRMLARYMAEPPPNLVSHDGLNLYKWFERNYLNSWNEMRVLRNRLDRKTKKPWMTPQLLQLIHSRNECRRQNRTLEYVLLKRVTQSTMRNNKRNFFMKLASEIDPNTGTQAMWNTFSRCRGRKTPSAATGDLIEQANLIANQFVAYTVPDRAIEVGDPFTNVLEDLNVPTNALFTLDELNKASSRLKPSAVPGPDGIPAKAWKKMPIEIQHVLLRIFNCWFESGAIPAAVKQAFQVSIAKKEPGQYRPIALLNTITKLYELLLKPRILRIIGELTPSYQFGFQLRKGAEDQLLRFVSHLQKKKLMSKHSLSLFLDIRKAFDRVNRGKLLQDLYDSGVRGRLSLAIKALLTGKSYRVLHKGVISRHHYTTENGVPQGGVLSPLLWNFYFRGIVEEAEDNLFVSAFADDLAVVVSGDHLGQLYVRMNRVFHAMNTWADSYGVDFNMAKVVTMETRCLRRAPALDQHCVSYGPPGPGQVVITKCSSYKYLGCIINSRLEFGPWVQTIVLEFKSRIQFLARLSKTMKVGRFALEIIYVAYVRGFANYGRSVWSRTKTLLDKVDCVDRRGLELVCGLLSRSPTESLYRESSLQQFSVNVHRNALRSFARYMVYRDTRFSSMGLPDFNQNVVAAVSVRRRTCLTQFLALWMDAALPLPLREDWPVPDPGIMPAIVPEGYIEIFTLHALYDSIEVVLPRRRKNDFAYFGDFWKERMMARVRVGRLPLRHWCHLIGLDDSPLCRQCGQSDETFLHIFGRQCPDMLSYQYLDEVLRLIDLPVPCLDMPLFQERLSFYMKVTIVLYTCWLQHS